MKRVLIFVCLIATSLSIHMQCEFGAYNWNGFGEHLTCDGKFEGMTERNVTVESINGHTKPGQGHDSQAVHINGQSSPFLPRGLTRYFPGMQQLFIFRSELKHISQSDFKEYDFLKTLALSRNNLSYIPYDTFDELVNLEYFSLSFNQLTTIPNLKNMTKLKLLFLFENSIETLSLDDLAHNTELEILWLYQNKLKYIDSDIFSTLTKLSQAWFRGNICVDEDFNFSSSEQRLAIKSKISEMCISDENDDDE